MNNTMVMYHYVRDDGKLRAFGIDRFRRQIAGLKERCEILTLTEMLEYRGGRPTCVLTFDDGVKDAVDGALPVLRDLRVRAVFLFLPRSSRPGA